MDPVFDEAVEGILAVPVLTIQNGSSWIAGMYRNVVYFTGCVIQM